MLDYRDEGSIKFVKQMLHGLIGVLVFRDGHYKLDDELSDALFLFVREDLPAGLKSKLAPMQHLH